MFRVLVLTFAMMVLAACTLEKSCQAYDTESALVSRDRKEVSGELGRISRQREEAITDLVKVLNRVDVSDEWDGTRHRVIMLLGEIGGVEAVPALIKKLTYIPQHDGIISESMARESFYPCAQALADIGSPAIPWVLEEIGSSADRETRDLAAWVISEIDGKEIAVFRLQKAADRASGVRKDRLHDAEQFVASYRPRWDNYPKGAFSKYYRDPPQGLVEEISSYLDEMAAKYPLPKDADILGNIHNLSLLNPLANAQLVKGMSKGGKPVLGYSVCLLLSSPQWSLREKTILAVRLVVQEKPSLLADMKVRELVVAAYKLSVCDRDFWVRREAVAGLADMIRLRIRADDIELALREALKDPDSGVRAAAESAIDELGSGPKEQSDRR